MLAINNALKKDPRAWVKWPAKHEFKDLAQLINKREPMLSHTLGFVDGVNLPVKEPSEVLKQNAFYSGWKAACFVSNVLVFTPRGTICFAALNRPGSWHDSYVARKLFDVLRDKTPSLFNILADSAFPSNKEIQGKIIAVAKEAILNKIANQAQYKEARETNRRVSSQRQAAEWGMRAVQGSYPRLTLPLPVDNKKRLLILRCAVLLFNYKANTTGINQIREVYNRPDPEGIL